MNKFITALVLSFVLVPAFMLGSHSLVEAHDIPPEILQFMADNPDATDAEFEAWITAANLGETYELWSDEEEFESFNLPNELVQFLLDNPDANEPEILSYIQSKPELAEWEGVVQKLLAGDTDPNSFTTNDLVLLNSLSQTFDEKLGTGSRNESGTGLNWGRFAVNYIKLGIDHILSGIDHVLFVMVLVLLLPARKRILAMVTTFTLAHSITLILGGTKILTLSAAIVEPIIAASIAYVALTSVFLSKKWPWLESQNNRLITIFIFGLFHGLGFAGVFAAVAPEAGRLIPSLLFFNVGVELGQILILCIWLPILYAVYRFKQNTWLVPLIASIISVLACWWVFERLFF